MNIPQSSFVYLALSLLISVIAPVVFFLYFKRSVKLAWKPIIIGAGVWILFTQVLEKLLHVLVITQTPLMQYPFYFGIYGALAAGIFEEVGRYIAFSTVLKKFRSWQDGISFGLGHGGIESILLGILICVQIMVLIGAANSGNLSELLKQLPQESSSGLVRLISAPDWTFLFIGIERLLALPIQIALSLIVLLSFVKHDKKYLFYAIVIHTFVDFTPAMYQTGFITLYMTEAILMLLAIGAIFFIQRSRKIFPR